MALSKIEQSGISNNNTKLRNLVINGDFRINQRGDASGVTTSKYTGPDRYKFSTGRTAAVFDISNETDVPSGSIGQSYKLTNTTSESTIGASLVARIQHRIEASSLQHLKNGTSGAKNMTLSFWVKSSVAGDYSFYLYKPDNTARIYRKSYTIDTADTWQKITHTISGDTAGGGITDDANEGMRITFKVYVGSNYYGGSNADATWVDYSGNDQEGIDSTAGTTWGTTDDSTFYLHNIQLEEGDAATEFETLPTFQQLNMCQRFYYRINSVGTSHEFGLGFSRSTTTAWFNFYYPVRMRDTPSAFYTTGTASDYGVLQEGSTITCSAVPSNNNYTKDHGMIGGNVSSGLTAGQANAIRFADANAFIAWESEL